MLKSALFSFLDFFEIASYVYKKGGEKMDNEKITKTYRLIINGQDVVVDAATLAVSEKRVKRYLKKLLAASKENTKSTRAFWGDIIMLNLLTDKILKNANPFTIEKAVSPLQYTRGKSKEVMESLDNVKSQYAKALSSEYMYGDELLKEEKSEPYE